MRTLARSTDLQGDGTGGRAGTTQTYGWTRGPLRFVALDRRFCVLAGPRQFTVRRCFALLHMVLRAARQLLPAATERPGGPPDIATDFMDARGIAEDGLRSVARFPQ